MRPQRLSCPSQAARTSPLRPLSCRRVPIPPTSLLCLNAGVPPRARRPPLRATSVRPPVRPTRLPATGMGRRPHIVLAPMGSAVAADPLHRARPRGDRAARLSGDWAARATLPRLKVACPSDRYECHGLVGSGGYRPACSWWSRWCPAWPGDRYECHGLVGSEGYRPACSWWPRWCPAWPGDRYECHGTSSPARSRRPGSCTECDTRRGARPIGAQFARR